MTVSNKQNTSILISSVEVISPVYRSTARSINAMLSQIIKPIMPHHVFPDFIFWPPNTLSINYTKTNLQNQQKPRFPLHIDNIFSRGIINVVYKRSKGCHKAIFQIKKERPVSAAIGGGMILAEKGENTLKIKQYTLCSSVISMGLLQNTAIDKVFEGGVK